MYPASTARFRKLSTCPATEVLTLYGEAALPREQCEAIECHLAACDFCGAEMHLLSRHRPYASPPFITASEIPAHLLRLARDLMSQPSPGRVHFVETICELDRLTLTDAV